MVWWIYVNFTILWRIDRSARVQECYFHIPFKKAWNVYDISIYLKFQFSNEKIFANKWFSMSWIQKKSKHHSLLWFFERNLVKIFLWKILIGISLGTQAVNKTKTKYKINFIVLQKKKKSKQNLWNSITFIIMDIMDHFLIT